MLEKKPSQHAILLYCSGVLNTDTSSPMNITIGTHPSHRKLDLGRNKQKGGRTYQILERGKRPGAGSRETANQKRGSRNSNPSKRHCCVRRDVGLTVGLTKTTRWRHRRREAGAEETGCRSGRRWDAGASSMRCWGGVDEMPRWRRVDVMWWRRLNLDGARRWSLENASGGGAWKPGRRREGKTWRRRREGAARLASARGLHGETLPSH